MAHVLGAVPQSGSSLGRRPARPAGLHGLPVGDLATDLVEQPAVAAEQGDPPSHRCGRHLHRPHRRHPARRGGPGRAERRVDRSLPLHGPPTPRQGPTPPDRVRNRRPGPAHRTHRIASTRDHRVAVNSPLQRTCAHKRSRCLSETGTIVGPPGRSGRPSDSCRQVRLACFSASHGVVPRRAVGSSRSARAVGDTERPCSEAVGGRGASSDAGRPAPSQHAMNPVLVPC